MKIHRCPVTDSGVTLTDPTQGFIVQGNIYVARLAANDRPDGGLIGDSHWLKAAGGGDVTLTVLTREEMFDALGFTVEEVEAWAREQRNRKQRNREYVEAMCPRDGFMSVEGTDGEAQATPPPG